MQMGEKEGKSRNTVFFQWIVAPEGRKVGSLKRRVRSQLARWEMKICTPLWREAHFQVKMYKKHNVRTTFGSCDVEKVHAVVARSTFRSQKMLKTQGVRTTFGSWDVGKKCTPLWPHKNTRVRTTFGCSDVEKVHTIVARSRFRSENVKNTRGSDHFWTLRCRKSARRCGAKHISKSKVQKTEAYEALLDVQMSLHVAGARDCAPCQKWAKREGFVAFSTTTTTTPHYIPIHYTQLHLITLHYITLQSTTLHYITLHYSTFHYTTLHYTATLHYLPLHYITLHYLPLHYITLHYTKLHYNYNYNYTTTFHYTPLHCTTVHYTTLHYTTFHYTTLRYTTLR